MALALAPAAASAVLLGPAAIEAIERLAARECPAAVGMRRIAAAEWLMIDSAAPPIRESPVPAACANCARRLTIAPCASAASAMAGATTG